MRTKEQKRSIPGKRRIFVSAGLAAFVIAAAAGGVVYFDRIAPLRKAVVVVNDVRVPMRYFLKRLRASGGSSMSVLNALITEEIVRQTAPNPPYGIEVDARRIDTFLRELAGGESDPLPDAEYREWLRQQLNETGFTENEFREIARVRLLADGLRAYLADRAPTVAEQVYLHFMVLDSREKATLAKSRLDAGEAFGNVAADLASGDLRKSGGVVGWVPRSALQDVVARVAFGALETGASSQPIQLEGESMGLAMVSDRSAAREIDPRFRDAIRANVLDEWLAREQERHHVEIHGLRGGYDSATDVWVSEQLRKMGE